MKTGGILSSMTGFGRQVNETPLGRITVEVRSLNHRFLEIGFKSSRDLLRMDPKVRELVRKKFSRGKVDVFLGIELKPGEFNIDLERARETAEALKPIAEKLGDHVKIDHILMASDIIQARNVDMPESFEADIAKTVSEALDLMKEHRLREGKSLKSDLSERVLNLSKIIDALDPIVATASQKARSQIVDFLEGIEMSEVIDHQRLESEVAMMSQRADVSEEMTRLRVHMVELEKDLGAGGVIGRRVDFLIQEIHREINTIGSKAGIAGVSRDVVDFKSELEKIREQVQNIE